MICTKSEMFDLMADTAAKLEYDLDARVVTWASKPLEQMFGYTLRGELEGQPIEVLIPSAKRAIHQQHIDGYAKHPEARTMGRRLVVEGQRRDGSKFPAAVQLNPGVAGPASARKRVVVAIIIDMSGVIQSDNGHVGLVEPEASPVCSPGESGGVPKLTPSPSSAIGLGLAGLVGLCSLALVLWVSALLWRGCEPMAVRDNLKAGIKLLHRGDYSGAADKFVLASNTGQDPVLSLGGLAECLYSQGKFDEAVSVCDDLARVVPNAGRADYIRGLVLVKRQEMDKAKEYLRSAVSKGDWVALAKLGVLEGGTE